MTIASPVDGGLPVAGSSGGPSRLPLSRGGVQPCSEHESTGCEADLKEERGTGNTALVLCLTIKYHFSLNEKCV